MPFLVPFPGSDTQMMNLFRGILKQYALYEIKRDEDMKVTVHDNQIEKALRDLKKKLTKEGFFSEIKERRFYDKPSVQKKKKRAKAAKRRRKRMRRVY